MSRTFPLYLCTNDTLTPEWLDERAAYNFTRNTRFYSKKSYAVSNHTRRARRKILRAAEREPHPGHFAHGPVDRGWRNRSAAWPFRLRKIDAAPHADRPLHPFG